VSRTRQALKILDENPGMKKAEVAALAGIHVNVLYNAIAARKRTEGMRCKHCGSLLPYLKDVIKK